MSKFILFFLFPLILHADKKLQPGQPFPAFTLPHINAAGKTSLASLKGKVVIVDFWASWCGPCQQELPGLDKILAEQKKKGLVIVAVNLDDEVSSATDFIKRYPVKLTLVHDNAKELANKVHIKTMPTSFVLDKKGIIKFIHLGFTEDELPKFKKEISSLL